VQQRLFQEQAHLARELDLPLVVHCREAVQETLDILIDTGMKDRKVLWHCFGGDWELAQNILGHSWTISIPGPVTFRKSDRLREAVAHIPLDQLVLETDCPFLTPEPFRGKRNEPALTVFTAQAVAKAQGRATEEVWAACGRTARDFFGLKN
jgi:TatD DNase family protein